MICPTCDRETSAFVELGEMGAKARRRCAFIDCKAVLPEEKPAQQLQVAPSVVDHAAAQANARPPFQSPSNGAPPSFAQIVAQAETRLLQVRERIAELRSLETEERQLVLILTAAGKNVPENKPS